jgi:hypothetical protein
LYNLKVTPTKIPVNYFVDIDKLAQKLKGKRPRRTVLEDWHCPASGLTVKLQLPRQGSFGRKKLQEDSRSRKQNRVQEQTQYEYSQLIFHKGAVQLRQDSLQKMNLDR